VGRNTQGVTLMRLAEDESLQAVERVDASLDYEETVATTAVDAATEAPSD
jgi:DNA gyrase subunit A